MHYFSGQQLCATCHHWRGPRMHDEGQFICCPRNVTGACTVTNRLVAPDSSCNGWGNWEHEWSGRAYLEQVNCWEYTACGFEEGGHNAAIHGVCPAFPLHGRNCASLENTKCYVLSKGDACAMPMSKELVCLQCAFLRNILAPIGASDSRASL